MVVGYAYDLSIGCDPWSVFDGTYLGNKVRQ